MRDPVENQTWTDYHASLATAAGAGVAICTTIWAAISVHDAMWLPLAAAFGVLWGSVSGVAGGALTWIVSLAVSARPSAIIPTVASSVAGALSGLGLAAFVFLNNDFHLFTGIVWLGASSVVSGAATLISRRRQ